MVRRMAATSLALITLVSSACDQASNPVGLTEAALRPNLVVTIPTVTVTDLWVCAEGPGLATDTYDFGVSTVSGLVTYLSPPVVVASDSTFSLAPDGCALIANTFQQSVVTVTLLSGPPGTVFSQTQIHDYLKTGGNDVGTPSPTGPPGTTAAQDVPLHGDKGTVIVFTSVPDVPPPEDAQGRMTGGGWQENVGGFEKVSHSFTLHCDNLLSNNIEINWDQNKFHIKKESLTSISCIEDPAYDHEQPVAPLNTFIGDAEGKLNNVAGATIHFTFIDNGEPGKDTDLAGFTIRDSGGNIVLDVPLGIIDGGNHQAHYDQPHGQQP